MQNALTVIVRIKPDRMRFLEETLEIIGKDINGNHEILAQRNELLDFNAISTVHFCRFVLLPNEDTGNFDHLLFTSNYDGTLQDHLNEFLDKAGDAMDTIWGCCEGYPLGVREKAPEQFRIAFREFIEAHSHDFNAFYIGYRGKSGNAIRRNARIRAQFEKHLDKVDASKPLMGKLKRVVAKMPQTRGDYTRPRGKVVKGTQWTMFFAELLIGLVVILVLKPIRDFLANKDDNLNLNLSDRYIQPGITEIEDAVTQNQITVISKIRPGIGVLLKLKIVLLGIQLFAQHIDNKGSLGGIATIHFARWAIIDRGRYLLFTSNYDGSWPSYIGDFVDKGAKGMDLIWTSAPNYPQQGSIDIEAFKDIIRLNQVRTQVFYSAYPASTVKNVINDAAITDVIEREHAQELLG